MAMNKKPENIAVGSLVRYSPYSTIKVRDRDNNHRLALGLVVSPPQFFGFNEKVQVQWFISGSLKSWSNVEDLEIVSESR